MAKKTINKVSKKEVKPKKEKVKEEIKTYEEIVEIHYSEPKLLCSVCGGEMTIDRDVRYRKEFKCKNCGRVLCITSKK